MSDYPGLDLLWVLKHPISVDDPEQFFIEDQRITGEQMYNHRAIVHRVTSRGGVSGYNRPIILSIAKANTGSYTALKGCLVTIRFRRKRR